jgi:hypothetical protein
MFLLSLQYQTSLRSADLGPFILSLFSFFFVPGTISSFLDFLDLLFCFSTFEHWYSRTASQSMPSCCGFDAAVKIWAETQDFTDQVAAGEPHIEVLARLCGPLKAIQRLSHSLSDATGACEG